MIPSVLLQSQESREILARESLRPSKTWGLCEQVGGESLSRSTCFPLSGTGERPEKTERSGAVVVVSKQYATTGLYPFVKTSKACSLFASSYRGVRCKR